MTPKWVSAMLDSRWFPVLARVVLCATLLIPGIMQAVQFKAAQAEFAHFGLNPTSVYVTASIITLIVGSVLVILGGKRTWLGAGALGVYIGLTILIVHHFWTMHGADAVNEMHTALEHISLIGGLMVVSVLEYRRRR